MKKRWIISIIILFVIGLVGILIRISIKEKRRIEYRNAFENGDYELAKNLNNRYYKNTGSWIHNKIEIDSAIENEKKANMSISEKIEAYPDEYISVIVNYGQHYKSGVWDYSLSLYNSSECNVVIKQIELSYNTSFGLKEERINVNIPLSAGERKETIAEIGKGQRRNGGSYTLKKDIDGNNAFHGKATVVTVSK